MKRTRKRGIEALAANLDRLASGARVPAEGAVASIEEWRALRTATGAVLGWVSQRAARAELERVHRIELAYLLREASRRRMAAGSPPDGAPPAPGDALEHLRARLREELESWDLDGLALSPDVLRVARGCRLGEPTGWPRAEELAWASLQVDGCAEGRECLRRARFTEVRGASRR